MQPSACLVAIHSSKNIYCPVLRGSRSVYCVALAFYAIPERAGSAEFKCYSCQGYHVLQCPALWSQQRLGIFAIFNPTSNHRSLFGPMQIMDFPSRSIVALLEPVRKLSPAYEVNPQYSPNMSGKSKIKKKLSEPHSVLARECVWKWPVSRLSQWAVSTPMYVPYRTAYLAGIVQGWGKCPRISEAGQRPKAFPTRDKLDLCFMLSTVRSTGYVHTTL